MWSAVTYNAPEATGCSRFSITGGKGEAPNHKKTKQERNKVRPEERESHWTKTGLQKMFKTVPVVGKGGKRGSDGGLSWVLGWFVGGERAARRKINSPDKWGGQSGGVIGRRL